jgi:cobyrinic acid a,c-diamide synthase
MILHHHDRSQKVARQRQCCLTVTSTVHNKHDHAALYTYTQLPGLANVPRTQALNLDRRKLDLPPTLLHSDVLLIVRVVRIGTLTSFDVALRGSALNVERVQTSSPPTQSDASYSLRRYAELMF